MDRLPKSQSHSTNWSPKLRGPRVAFCSLLEELGRRLPLLPLPGSLHLRVIRPHGLLFSFWVGREGAEANRWCFQVKVQRKQKGKPGPKSTQRTTSRPFDTLVECTANFPASRVKQFKKARTTKDPAVAPCTHEEKKKQLPTLGFWAVFAGSCNVCNCARSMFCKALLIPDSQASPLITHDPR